MLATEHMHMQYKKNNIKSNIKYNKIQFKHKCHAMC